MRGYPLKTIVEAVNGELSGDPELLIEAVRTPLEAGEGDICVLVDPRALELLDVSAASALIVPFKVKESPKALIRVANPRLALIQLLELFCPEKPTFSGVDPRAAISPQAHLGPEVAVGFGAWIGREARIGARVRIHPNVYIGDQVEIGEETQIFPNVTIGAGSRIGKRVRIHSGTVIGSDGFGYLKEESGVYRKIPQVGSVEIGDDVEIGAGCAIDRATLGTTRIGSGTKIDNLVQIGHNVEIGRDCCIVAQVGLSGSVHVGNHCVLAGQVGIRDHVKLEDGVVVGAQAGVMHDLGEGEWLGYPALPANQARRVYSLFTRLPDLRRQIRALEKRCSKLEEELETLAGNRE